MKIQVSLNARLQLPNNSPRFLYFFLQVLEGEVLVPNTEYLFKDRFLINPLNQKTIDNLLSKLNSIDYANYANKLNEILSNNFIVMELSVDFIEDDERLGKKFCNACGHYVDKDHEYCDFCGRDDSFEEE